MTQVLENHKVVLRSMRYGIEIERNYGNLTHNEIAVLIKETNSKIMGLRVVDVRHTDGTRCEAIAKAVA